MRAASSTLGLAGLLALLTGCPSTTTTTPPDPARFEVWPTRLELGRVALGAVIEREVFVRNPGGSPLGLGLIVTPADDPMLSATLEASTLGARTTSRVRVRFAPERGGEHRVVLRLVPDAGLAPVEVEVVGTATATVLRPDPERVDFGPVVIGQQQRRTVRLAPSPDGAVRARLMGTGIEACGAGGTAPFCWRSVGRPLTEDGAIELEAGASLELELEYAPRRAGPPDTASLVLETCAFPACQRRLELVGTPADRVLSCDVTTLDFGFTNLGACPSRRVRCTSLSTAQLAITDWQLEATAGSTLSPELRLPAWRASELLLGEALELELVYCPVDRGPDEARLVITTDHPEAPRAVIELPVRGVGGGPDIELTPARLDFGLASSVVATERRIRVENRGVELLELLGVDADLDATGAFTARLEATRLEPGAATDLIVAFRPTAPGAVRSRLLLRSNDPDEAMLEVPLAGEGRAVDPCRLARTVDTLDFGTVERARSLQRAVELRNRGTGDCLVSGARISPIDAAFSLPRGEPISQVIPPGSSLIVPVELSASSTGAAVAELSLSVSSTDSPVRVALSGRVAESTLLIAPHDVDFGVVGIGCQALSRRVRVYNPGTVTAVVTRIALSEPGHGSFALEAVPLLPQSLEPAGSMAFEVRYRADLGGAFATGIEIDTLVEGSTIAYVLGVSGRAEGMPRQVDRFEQLGRPEVDVLWVIDDSGSMSEEQASLAANFQAFIEFAEAQGLDYHLAVTTTDVSGGERGRFVPLGVGTRVVTPATQPSPVAAFVRNARVGTSGSGTERGLEAAYLALSNPLIAGHNAGFLRPNATLSVVVVSDENDSSTRDLDFYTSFLLSVKGERNAERFSLSAIVGDPPSGCRGDGGRAQAGLRYLEVAQRTGGVFQSICTADWARALEELSTTAFGFRSRFVLTNRPVVSTLSVQIDGVDVPAVDPGGRVDWSYDLERNAVDFSPFATPEPGAELRIEYAVECL